MTSFVNPSEPISTLGMSMAMATQLDMLSGRLRGRAPINGARIMGIAAAPDAPKGQDGNPEPASQGYPSPAPSAPPRQQQNIDAEDWDILFDAVTARLRLTVNSGMESQPDVRAHLAPESANPVQAVVLDCVTEMDKLHASLKQERSQRLTP